MDSGTTFGSWSDKYGVWPTRVSCDHMVTLDKIIWNVFVQPLNVLTYLDL